MKREEASRGGMSERNSSREQTNMLLMRIHPTATDHRTRPISDKPMSACAITNIVYTHGHSAPLSRHQHQHQQNIVLQQPLKRKCEAQPWRIGAMFGDEQPKRKGISKEPDKATSEPRRGQTTGCSGDPHVKP